MLCTLSPATSNTYLSTGELISLAGGRRGGGTIVIAVLMQSVSRQQLGRCTVYERLLCANFLVLAGLPACRRTSPSR